MAHRIAFVVATKDRPEELGRLWRSLVAQTRPPDEVIIVDASAEPSPPAAPACSPVFLRHIATAVASATRQRNLGLDAAGSQTDLVGFLDDDAVLEENAVEEMLRFFDAASPEVGGAAFNMTNHPPLGLASLKHTWLAGSLGLYSKLPGTVAPSGFQTMIGPVETTAWTDWLPSGASVWRREIFRGCRFDEWFDGYSYLEDLDFSYRVRRAYRLAVVAGARYRHLPAEGGRGGGYVFGVREVLNRTYFVRKNAGLSLGRCYAALAVRLAMSLALAVREGQAYHAARACGNAIGLVRAALKTG